MIVLYYSFREARHPQRGAVLAAAEALEQRQQVRADHLAHRKQVWPHLGGETPLEAIIPPTWLCKHFNPACQPCNPVREVMLPHFHRKNKEILFVDPKIAKKIMHPPCPVSEAAVLQLCTRRKSSFAKSFARKKISILFHDYRASR